MEKVLYSELNPTEFRDRIKVAPIAYLPLGTLEWHGEHLPLGSDSIQSQDFFEKLAREVGGIVLPSLFLGPDRMMVDHAAMNETSLVMALRPDLVEVENLPKDLKVWPVGIGGKDPRIHASKELGDKIITLQLGRMQAILNQKLKEL